MKFFGYPFGTPPRNDDDIEADEAVTLLQAVAELKSPPQLLFYLLRQSLWRKVEEGREIYAKLPKPYWLIRAEEDQVSLGNYEERMRLFADERERFYKHKDSEYDRSSED